MATQPDINKVFEMEEGDLASFIAEAIAVSASRGRDQWEANFRAIEGRLEMSERDEVKIWLGEWCDQ